MPVRPLLRSACVLALALASGSAVALGLGQIQVKSGPGEPLVAEIPVISNDPAELRQLQASLASPETFTRIGLEPPIGVVADLRFSTSADASGRPVIRVTTTQPVTEPVLTFLVEVDWGQGRLVREYSALVATPSSVAAQPVAPVQVPQVEAPPVVERPSAAAPVATAPVPADPIPAPTPAPAPGPAPLASTAPVPTPPGGDVQVRRGDTLSAIAARVAPADVTAAQTMVGLLRANPDAFIAGDMNRVRSGSVLRVPAASELEAIEAREAAALVRTYARQWRQARSQPQAVAQADAPAEPQARGAAAPVAGGRLEIVPPGAGRASQAGTQSGIAAGGEGEMLRQELQQSRETLAARDAELRELQSRIAELERLQNDQQKLIALKDAELNAAQQRTAQASTAAPDAAAEAGSSALPWVAGAALVLLGLLAAAWNRRRTARAAAFRAPAARASVADAFAPALDPSAGRSAAAQASVPPAPVATSVTRPADPVPVVDAVPSWERGARKGARRASRAPAAASAGVAAAVADPLAPQVEAANAERLELAQAYLDLGDTARASELLAEVESSGDATARSVASRMRQGLG